MNTVIERIIKKPGQVKARLTESNRISDLLKHNGWVEIEPEVIGNFIPVVPDHIFTQLVKYYMDGGNDEVAGNFYIDPGSHTIEYVSLVEMPRESTVAAVNVSAGQAADRLVKDREAGYEPNGQWHTHPTFGAFWSSTDVNDQIKDIELAKAFNKSGERFFMCVSGLDILVRRVRWDNGLVTYQDCELYLMNGRRLSGLPRWRAATSYSPGSYGLGIADAPVLNHNASLAEVAAKMERDPKFHEKLTLYQRNQVRDLIEDKYGNIYVLTEYLDTITVTEAVNVVFNTYGVELGDELLSDRALMPLIGILEKEHFNEQGTTARS